MATQPPRPGTVKLRLPLPGLRAELEVQPRPSGSPLGPDIAAAPGIFLQAQLSQAADPARRFHPEPPAPGVDVAAGNRPRPAAAVSLAQGLRTARPPPRRHPPLPPAIAAAGAGPAAGGGQGRRDARAGRAESRREAG